MKILPPGLYFLSLICLILTACGVDPEDSPGLHYTGPEPLVIKPGDTVTPAFKYVGATSLSGKSTTVDPFTDFTLTTEADSNLLKVRGNEIIGVADSKGNVTVTARKNSTSAGFSVHVKP